MRKIITVIMLVIAITLCGACTSPQEFDDLKTQTAALERLISSQQELIDELQNKLNGNDQDKALLQEEIEKQQKQIDKYEVQIRNLSGASIEFTAKEPIYKTLAGSDELIHFSNKGTAYQDLCEYYKENRPNGDRNVPIFRHKENDDVYYFEEKYVVGIKNGEALIYQDLLFYDEVLGNNFKDAYRQMVPEQRNYSLSLQFYWAPSYMVEPLPDLVDTYIEFGYYEYDMEIAGKIWTFRETYFNMYYGGSCIGTCYYEEGCYISHTGMHEYIWNRLIPVKGDEK